MDREEIPACKSEEEFMIDEFENEGGAVVSYSFDVSYGIEEDDTITNPQHYNTGDIECIDAIKASLTEEEFSGYLKGNILKYVCRYKHKGMPLKDLMKSEWYLQKLIKEQKTNEE